MSNLPDIDPSQQMAIESAVYRKLIQHLRKHPQVQNIDLMNLAYFCRNCLAKWYRSAAAEQGAEMEYEQARELVYGMPYAEYQSHHAEEASAEQLQRLAEAQDKATR